MATPPITYVRHAMPMVEGDAPSTEWQSYLFAVVGAEYVLKLLPKGTHDYAKFLTPAELGSFARSAGLAAAGIAGIAYNPFNRSFRLVQDTSVNYMLALRRPPDG